jgi:hypothetical protein
LAADRPSFRYREDVLAELWKYGVRPTEYTRPELTRGFINELYKYELRKLRDRYVRGEFPKREYHRLVIEIREKYPVLALTPRQWLRT